MLKVLHLVNEFNLRLGGSIWASFQIARCAHSEGVKCELAGTFNERTDSSAYFQKEFSELTLHRFRSHFPRHNQASIPLFRWLRRHAADYDLIHCHQIFNWPFVHGCHAAARARKPLVISPHNSLDPEDLRKHAWLKERLVGPYLLNPLLSRASVIHCTSEAEARRIETYDAEPAPERRVIPLPVPKPLHQAPGSQFRQRFSIAKESFVILYLSRLDRKKGLDMLIEAFGRLKAIVPNSVLAIAGDGDPQVKEESARQIARLGLPDAIRWCGFLTGPNKTAAFLESDLFVLPSRYENFALAVVEAMYAGLPVLTTKGVFIWELLAGERGARICEPAPHDLFNALLDLARNEAARRELALRGPAVAEKHFSPEKVGRLYRSMYRDVVLSGSKTECES